MALWVFGQRKFDENHAQINEQIAPETNPQKRTCQNEKHKLIGVVVCVCGCLAAWVQRRSKNKLKVLISIWFQPIWGQGGTKQDPKINTNTKQSQTKQTHKLTNGELTFERDAFSIQMDASTAARFLLFYEYE